MNKAAKEMKQKLAIRQTQNSIKKYIDYLTARQDKYLQLAKSSKEKGATNQYALALNGLKACMIQKKKAEEMMLNIELACQMRDLTQMTSMFLGTLQNVSKDMIKTTKSMDFAKVITNFETAMANVENSTEQLDVLLDASNNSYESLFSGKDDKDLNNLVNDNINSESNKIDDDIEKDLKEIEKMINKEGF